MVPRAFVAWRWKDDFPNNLPQALLFKEFGNVDEVTSHEAFYKCYVDEDTDGNKDALLLIRLAAILASVRVGWIGIIIGTLSAVFFYLFSQHFLKKSQL